MTNKKTKSKVGGTRIRRARKPSIIAIIVLALLSLGGAVWFIFQSNAATYGPINVEMYTPGGTPVQGGGITVSSVDANNNNMSTECQAYPTTTTGVPFVTNIYGTDGRMCLISNLNSTSKRYRILSFNVPAGWTLDSNQINITGSWFDWGTRTFDLTQGGFRVKMVAIPPPTPSGCGAGTLNDKCATIDGYMFSPPGTIPYGGTATISWQSTNANRCNLVWGSNGSGWQSADGTYRVGPLTSMYNYVLTCEPSFGGSAPARNISIPVSAAPTANLTASSTNIPYNGTTQLYWSSNNTSSCNLSGPGAPGVIDTSKSPWTTPKLTSGANYVLICKNAADYAAPTKTVAITVGGKPPDPVPDGCGPGTKNNTCKPGTGGGGGGTTTTSKPPTTVANNAPTSGSQKPSAPGNLKAEETNGAVDLSWDASTDDKGIANYIIERSTDNKEWSTLSESSDTTYTDTDANFNTLYYYRVSAKDTDGNVSDYAVAEITTGAFEANAFKDSDSTITSEDGVVVAKIPAGALSEDAACEIVIDEESQQALGKKKLLHGPYKLVCKKKDGSTFDKFDKPITYELTISDESKRKNPALYGFADNQWTKSNVSYSKDAPNFTFESDVPAPFAVLSESSLNWLWILLIILLLGILVGAFLWWRRRNSDDGAYVGSGYNPSTMYGDASASTQPAANPGAMTIPSAPVSDDSHAPGQPQIEVKPSPVHNPALEHHSPLDRLNEMEEAETKQDIPGDLTAPGDTAAGGVQPKDPGK